MFQWTYFQNSDIVKNMIEFLFKREVFGDSEA